MALVTEQLGRLFSVHLSLGSDHASLCDLSIAYGLLLKEATVDSGRLSDELCQEVRLYV